MIRRLQKRMILLVVCGLLLASAGLEDRVRGLESGADYYLPKPFQMAELAACLRAITRRREDAPVMELAFGDVLLNQQEAKLVHRVTGQEVKLGAKEFQLMELFLRNSGQTLPKDTIFDRVWGYETEADVSSLEVYLYFLRKKLTFIGSRVNIKATRGIGYSLEAEA